MASLIHGFAMSELTIDGGAVMEATPHTINSPMRMTMRRFRQHRAALFSLFVLGLVILSALLIPLGRYTPTEQNPKNAFMPPSTEHWFGTDDLGRDVFTRTLYGGRISLTVGLAATAIALMIGMFVGAVAGYSGGVIDNMLMRMTDAFLSLPSLFVLILISTMLRDVPLFNLRNSVTMVIVIIAILSWMWPARLIRSAFLSFRERRIRPGCAQRWSRSSTHHDQPHPAQYRQLDYRPGYAGRCLRHYRRIRLELSWFWRTAADAKLGQSTGDRTGLCITAPWLMIFPGLMIFITTLSINHIGDGLRDAFDPRSVR